MGSSKTGRSGFEETLTEDQLLARFDTALEWSRRAWKLSTTSEQEKATPARVATWEKLVEYSECIEYVADGVLRVKLTDRLASLTSHEKEELLREWAAAQPGSYESRKLGKCSGVISRDQAVSTIRKYRGKLKTKHAVFCTAARAFEIPEDDEFFPGYGTLLARPNQPKKKRAKASLDETTEFRQWIGEILKKSGIRTSALNVAKQIKVDDRRVEEQYRGDGKNPQTTLDKVLLANRTLKKHFETLVSDVRGLVQPTGY
ncbi:MAG TPA: hypothetical protein VGR47_19060 [Terracidiphilus sp.]|nr:hypothetical protein [Terracidiphilus sp.]